MFESGVSGCSAVSHSGQVCVCQFHRQSVVVLMLQYCLFLLLSVHPGWGSSMLHVVR